ncbi:MAG: hypothetical protein QOK42_2626 [Frankiaceae bacterium]|jgi:hypothetical protein|nr:hypothetical protein [Frankiaceae bacterium]
MTMRRTPPVVLSVAALALAVSAAVAGPTPAGPAAVTPASVQKYAAGVHVASYPVFDARGRKIGSKTWRWSDVGGDCCETYVAATATGRLLEFGGVVPYYSDDRGKSWWKVTPTTPLYNGEGALVAGPGGNVYGAGWDAYTGDHLQGFRYTKSSAAWEVSEVPLKSPFFDREWVTYAKGPFTIGGTKYPFATIIRGGGVTKSLEVISGDGLDYSTPSIPSQEATGSEFPLFRPRVVKNPDADFWQPNPGTYTLPLNAGGVLLFKNGDDDFPCVAARLDQTTAKWGCVRLPWIPRGTVRQDSRGWLTEVVPSAQSLSLALSTDGGKAWKSIDITVPEGRRLEGGSDPLHDVKVNGKAGIAAISVRADDSAGRGQDMVFVVDVKRAQPRLLRTYYLGKGDINTGIGVGTTSNRFDFCSVTVFPDGKIAASFDDSTTPDYKKLDTVPATKTDGHSSPAVAIEL